MSRKNYKKRKILFITEVVLSVICAILMIFCIITSLRQQDGWNSHINEGVGVTVFNAGKCRTVTEEIPEYGGVRVTYEIPSLPGSSEGEFLAIWLVHAYSDVYIGDELRYRCSEPVGPHMGHTPGYYWALIPLTDADIGATVRIVVTPAYRGVRNIVPGIFKSNMKEMIRMRLRGEGSLLIISILCIFEGLIFSLFTLLMKVEGRPGRAVFFMGLVLIDLGLWKLTDLPVISLIFTGHAMFLTYSSLFTLMLIVPVISRFLSWRDEKDWMYALLCEVFLAIDIILIVVHVLDIRDLRDNLPLIQVFLVLGFSIILERSIINIGRNLKDWQAWAFMLLAVAGLTDFAIYYYVENSLHLGLALTLSFFYGLTNGVLVLRGVFKQKELIERKNIEIRENRLALMMSQIRPHFLYNALNTIYSLCSTDSEGARETIANLSGYLRLNFENMDSVVPVPFKDELAHTRFYLSIEKKRFGDDLNVVYDIGTEDFAMPALSLQVIAENAVKHGIRKADGKGTLTIRTWTEDGLSCVSVSDDGAGFDVNAWEAEVQYDEASNEEMYHRRHVGLSNVRSRIEEMSGGRMEVVSSPGAGTEVIIRIPRVVAVEKKRRKLGRKEKG